MALTAGVSLKPQHFDVALACAVPGLWFEVHPENYFVAGGPRLAWLETLRARHPLSLHGVALSLAADQRPDAKQLWQLARLAQRVEPALISEHLAWAYWNGVYHPDLLPFARSHAALSRIADNILITQEVLKRRIAIENPSHYLHIDGHDWSETDFLAELTRRTGCGLLLDVNNVFVSARNLGYDAARYLDQFPLHEVMEIHLAGHSLDPALGERLLIDTHDAPVDPAVWALYERVIRRSGPRPTLIERDDNLPAFETLLAETAQAAAVLDAQRARAA
jgi:uncharacterized protein